jgi:hypothetical protein
MISSPIAASISGSCSCTARVRKWRPRIVRGAVTRAANRPPKYSALALRGRIWVLTVPPNSSSPTRRPFLPRRLVVSDALRAVLLTTRLDASSPALGWREPPRLRKRDLLTGGAQSVTQARVDVAACLLEGLGGLDRVDVRLDADRRHQPTAVLR